MKINNDINFNVGFNEDSQMVLSFSQSVDTSLVTTVVLNNSANLETIDMIISGLEESKLMLKG